MRTQYLVCTCTSVVHLPPAYLRVVPCQERSREAHPWSKQNYEKNNGNTKYSLTATNNTEGIVTLCETLAAELHVSTQQEKITKSAHVHI